MAIYDGVVTLAEDDIPVIVELDERHVRLSASGKEIGRWPTDEITITHVDDAIYAITAENETLQFVPNQPSLFAAELNGSGERSSVPLPPEREADQVSSDGVREAPPPRPLTVGLFYALTVATAGLAIWSLIRIIF